MILIALQFQHINAYSVLCTKSVFSLPEVSITDRSTRWGFIKSKQNYTTFSNQDYPANIRHAVLFRCKYSELQL